MKRRRPRGRVYTRWDAVRVPEGPQQSGPGDPLSARGRSSLLGHLALGEAPADDEPRQHRLDRGPGPRGEGPRPPAAPQSTLGAALAHLALAAARGGE